MEVTNDNSCSWINDLNPRTNIKSLLSNEESDWLIIGAGYTGLSAARKLGQLYPNQKILLKSKRIKKIKLKMNSNILISEKLKLKISQE